MVLQTSCRCLREVDAKTEEKALIWLNDSNAKILNEQLKQQQQTSIQEINRAYDDADKPPVQRHSRMEQLALPLLDFYQLRVIYRAVIETEIQPRKDLRVLADDLENHRDASLVITTDFEDMESGTLAVSEFSSRRSAGFKHWLHDIAKTSFHMISVECLYQHEEQLREIFNGITLYERERIYWDEIYDRQAIERRIRLAFSPGRRLQTSAEVIPATAELLLVDRLSPVDFNDKLYPDQEDREKILQFDETPPAPRTAEDKQEIQRVIENLRQLNMDTSQLEQQLDGQHATAVAQRNKSFHYLPYAFTHSGFELELLRKVLSLEPFQQSPLEIYYNGERGLTGFVIQCFQKKGDNWQNIGRYTTDFLIIRRDGDDIHKVLMIETKGSGYAHDPGFQDRKSFIESEFLKQNNRQFGYDKFDFLYLQDSDGTRKNIDSLSRRISGFFGEPSTPCR